MGIVDIFRASLRRLFQSDAEQLAELAAARPTEKLNWQESIVDRMKLLGLDSSLTMRKKLANELGYSGALDGSAEMNIWLLHQSNSALRVGVKYVESGI